MRSSSTVLGIIPHHGGGNRHDDRTGRICARPLLGQGRSGTEAHHRRDHYDVGRAVSAGRATRDPGGASSGLAGGAGRLRPVVPAAGAALVVWATSGPDPDQPRPHPRGLHTAGSGPARGGGAGHDPARRLGSLDGGHRGGGPYAADWLGRAPLSVARGGTIADLTWLALRFRMVAMYEIL